jgi:DinB superfamily
LRRLGLALVLAAAVAALRAEGLTDLERQRLITHYEMTEAWLVSEVSGLTDAQLHFRPAPDAWHILDVVEHLAVAEPQYWERVGASMKERPAAEPSEATDAGILWYGIDRTNRTRTGEARVPTGRYGTVNQALGDFRALRGRILQYVKTTTEEPRAHRLLEGNMDVYQWLLMISTHSQRHILQIREIKSNAAYPR